MEKVIEAFTDYFLRYTADVPAHEAGGHEIFDSDCKCQPEVTFNKENGWRIFNHKSLENKKMFGNGQPLPENR